MSAKAIAAVTSLLANTIGDPANPLQIGRPRVHSNGLFLFLYGIHVDEHLRNTPIDEGQVPPLWLVLKYLLVGSDGEVSGSLRMLEAFGLVLQKAHSNECLQYVEAMIDLPYRGLLEPVRQEFKLSLEELSADTISRILVTPESGYSCGIGLQLRPLPLAADIRPRFTQLVGVNYEQSPSRVLDPVQGDGRNITMSVGVSPAILQSVEPSVVMAGQNFALRGEALAQGVVEDACIDIGGLELAITQWSQKELRATLALELLLSGRISSGIHELRVKYRRADNRFNYSSSIPLRIVPRVQRASVPLLNNLLGDYLILELEGEMLGAQGDDVNLALQKDGQIVAASTRVELYSPNSYPEKFQRQVVVYFENQNPEAGIYNLLYRVNGQQAIVAPRFEVT